jgi:hypothetical protein
LHIIPFVNSNKQTLRNKLVQSQILIPKTLEKQKVGEMIFIVTSRTGVKERSELLLKKNIEVVFGVGLQEEHKLLPYVKKNF